MASGTLVSFALGRYAEVLPEWAQDNLKVTAANVPDVDVILVVKTNTITPEYEAFVGGWANIRIVTHDQWIQELGMQNLRLRDEEGQRVVFNLNHCQSTIDFDAAQGGVARPLNRFAVEKDMWQVGTAAAWKKDGALHLYDLDHALTNEPGISGSFKVSTQIKATVLPEVVLVQAYQNFPQGTSLRAFSKIQEELRDFFIKTSDELLKTRVLTTPLELDPKIMCGAFIRENSGLISVLGVDRNINWCALCQSGLTVDINLLRKHGTVEDFVQQMHYSEGRAGETIKRIASDKGAHKNYRIVAPLFASFLHEYVLGADEAVVQQVVHSNKGVEYKNGTSIPLILQSISFNEIKDQYVAYNSCIAYREAIKDMSNLDPGQEVIVYARNAAKDRRDYVENVLKSDNPDPQDAPVIMDHLDKIATGLSRDLLLKAHTAEYIISYKRDDVKDLVTVTISKLRMEVDVRMTAAGVHFSIAQGRDIYRNERKLLEQIIRIIDGV